MSTDLKMAKLAILETFQRFNRDAGKVVSERMMRSQPVVSQCSGTTLQAALDELLADGLIEHGQGLGWYRLTAAGAAAE